jgi:hypothetical protein
MQKQILAEEKTIEKLEKEILQHEDKLITEKKQIGGNISANGKLMVSLQSRRHLFVRKFARHKFFYTMAISIGVVLVWRGIWEITSKLPILSESIVALIVGIGILWAVERYTELSSS